MNVNWLTSGFRHASARATAGVPDGFDGITDRGHPDRLLMSQWLLAQEVPLEFARRAAEGELLYLAPARQHDSGEASAGGADKPGKKNDRPEQRERDAREHY